MTEKPTSDQAADTEQTETLEQYKERVRAVALREKQKQGWCDEGTNEILAELGLEPVPQPRQFTFRAPTTGILEYRVTAYDEDTARKRLAEEVDYDAQRFASTRGYRSPEYGRVTDVQINRDGLTLVANEDTF